MAQTGDKNGSSKRKAAALKYDPSRNGAPVVVASGMGYTAERIAETAMKAGVPVYEDDSLATLLTQLKLGSEIPRELYQAIVEIYLYFLKFTVTPEGDLVKGEGPEQGSAEAGGAADGSGAAGTVGTAGRAGTGSYVGSAAGPAGRTAPSGGSRVIRRSPRQGTQNGGRAAQNYPGAGSGTAAQPGYSGAAGGRRGRADTEFEDIDF